MKNKNLKKTLGYSLTMGGTALIAGASPAPMKAPIQAVASAGSPWVAPMASVSGAGIVIDQLKSLKPKKRKRRYK